MGFDVYMNVKRIAYGEAPSRPLVGVFMVGEDPIHAIAHEVFQYEADITPCSIDNPDRVLAVGELVLDVVRFFSDDQTLSQVNYQIPTEGL